VSAVAFSEGGPLKTHPHSNKSRHVPQQAGKKNMTGKRPEKTEAAMININVLKAVLKAVP